MPRFSVGWEVRYSYSFEIDAADSKEAETQARDLLESGPSDYFNLATEDIDITDVIEVPPDKVPLYPNFER